MDFTKSNTEAVRKNILEYKHAVTRNVNFDNILSGFLIKLSQGIRKCNSQTGALHIKILELSVEKPESRALAHSSPYLLYAQLTSNCLPSQNRVLLSTLY